MKKLNKEQKGITMVALVITIIVLLILAGITIAQLSNSGLFDKSKQAKEEYQSAQEDEETKISKYGNEIDCYVNGDRATTYCTTPATTSSTASITNPCVIIKNYRNGTEWYRVWSDGWIEQGGRATGPTTINFLINFTTTDYTISTAVLNDVDDPSAYPVKIRLMTNSSFYAKTDKVQGTKWYDDQSVNFSWQACGY